MNVTRSLLDDIKTKQLQLKEWKREDCQKSDEKVSTRKKNMMYTKTYLGRRE
jgi:hypothetical protein